MKKIIILENQRGLHIKKGRVIGEVGPGVYRSSKFNDSSYEVYSLVPLFYAAINSFNTNDMANVTIEVPVTINIRNIKKHYLSGALMYEVVSQAIAKELEKQVSSQSLADVLAAQPALDAAALNTALAEVGLEISIEGNARIRLPRNLQNAIDAQEVARQRAKAELEEARGRTAILRHYANAAKMTKDNPELLRLLLGQKAKSVNIAFDASK